MTILYLNSDKMGSGDEQLGSVLIENFLEKLANIDIKIDFIACINSGVKLTTTGSSVVDILKKFEDKGAKIASCGTCLDYFNLRTDLNIGEVGTMDKTAQLLATADKIIRP